MHNTLFYSVIIIQSVCKVSIVPIPVTSSANTSSSSRVLESSTSSENPSTGVVFARVLPDTKSSKKVQIAAPSGPSITEKDESGVEGLSATMQKNSSKRALGESDSATKREESARDLQLSTVGDVGAAKVLSSNTNIATTESGASSPSFTAADFTSGSTQQQEEVDDGKPHVFVDANYHVMYKEYNLRRSKTFLTTVNLLKKQKPEASSDLKDAAKDLPEKALPERKRERSVDDSTGAQETKKLKIDKESVKLEKENTEVAKEITEVDKKKPESPAKISPSKTARARLPSQSKKSRKKRHISVSQGADSSDVIVCGLCCKKDSVGNLGFLYGPYKPVANDKESPARVAEEVAVKDAAELWVHEDCAVWAPGVCIVRGGKLIGLHEAVADGKKLVGIVHAIDAYTIIIAGA